MSATEWTILEALVSELAELTGLHPYAAAEPEMVPPACFPLFDQDFNIDWDKDSGPIDGDLMVVTPWVKGLSRAGYRTLADYVADSGTKSINVKLHNSTLGGVVKAIQVKGVARGELVTFPDGRAYYARPLRIRIYV